MYQCFHCQTPWESSLRQPAVKETCTQCGAYLHCCKNCRFHRRGYPNECYIPDTEKIADKRRANFCDEFEFRAVTADGAQPSTTLPGLEQLWGEEAPEPASGRGQSSAVADWLKESDAGAPRDFDDLFND